MSAPSSVFTPQLDTKLFSGSVSIDSRLFINSEWVEPQKGGMIECSIPLFLRFPSPPLQFERTRRIYRGLGGKFKLYLWPFDSPWAQWYQPGLFDVSS